MNELVNHGDSTDVANFRPLRNRHDELFIDRSAISDDLDSRVESTLATRSFKLQRHEPKQVGSNMTEIELSLHVAGNSTNFGFAAYGGKLHPTEIPTSHVARNKHKTPSPRSQPGIEARHGSASTIFCADNNRNFLLCFANGTTDLVLPNTVSSDFVFKRAIVSPSANTRVLRGSCDETLRHVKLLRRGMCVVE